MCLLGYVQSFFSKHTSAKSTLWKLIRYAINLQERHSRNPAKKYDSFYKVNTEPTKPLLFFSLPFSLSSLSLHLCLFLYLSRFIWSFFSFLFSPSNDCTSFVNFHLYLHMVQRILDWRKSIFQLRNHVKNAITYQPIRLECTLSLPPKNIRKPYGFLMFPGGRERVHWEQMG